MPEEALDVPHVGASAEEVCRAGMAQGVGRDHARDFRRRHVAPYELVDGDGREPFALGREEEPGLARITEEKGPDLGEVVVQGQGRSAGYGHDTVLPPLPVSHEEGAVEEVEAGDVEPDALGEPDPRPVEELEDGLVPHR